MIKFEPIGTIHSPFKDLEQMPIQPTSASSSAGVVEIFPEYVDGLRDLDGFSHIILIYHFDRVSRVDLTVVPFLDLQPRGVFSTRAPTRPNPIGLSVVKLVRVEGPRIYVSHIDILDATPLLDIKPYVPDFDQPQQAQIRLGWLAASGADVKDKKSDDRFK
jgi:tRNA-Thr(GGU) m(6)t(6)A37 methyltransferase TsaA